MSKKKEDAVLSFGIHRVELLQKYVSAPNDEDVALPAFILNLQVSLDTIQGICAQRLEVKMHHKDDEGERPLAAFVVQCDYALQGFEQMIINDEQGTRLPEDIVVLLTTVTIGTARGILYSELKGTYLADAILPVVDPTKFRMEKPGVLQK